MHRFTSEFGMGSGGTSALWPPGKLGEARVVREAKLHTRRTAGTDAGPDHGARDGCLHVA